MSSSIYTSSVALDAAAAGRPVTLTASQRAQRGLYHLARRLFASLKKFGIALLDFAVEVERVRDSAFTRNPHMGQY